MEKQHWSRDAVFYHIYPLGQCGGPHTAGSDEPVVARIRELESWLPHIRSLGADTLLLGPVFASGSHGYDTSDLCRIDPRLGSNEDFSRFCEAARAAGFRIVVDGVFHHVGRGHARFRELQERGDASGAKEWFSGVDFTRRSSYGDNFAYDGWNGHFSLVKLKLENPEVREHLFGAVRMWIEQFGIDGLRLDAADCLPGWFLEEIAAFCRGLKPGFWLMGEVIHGDYRNWVRPGCLDATTNYECYKGLWSSHNDRNYFELAWSLKRLFGADGIYREMALYNFTDNHDVTRVGSILKEYAHIFPLHILLFTMPGIPSLYYGSEWGVQAVKGNGDDWNLRPRITERGGDEELAAVIRRLTALRRDLPALRHGSYRELEVAVGGEQFAFCREHGTATVIVAVNAAAEEKFLHPGRYFSGRSFRDLLNGDRRYDAGEPVPLQPRWGVVLRME